MSRALYAIKGVKNMTKDKYVFTSVIVLFAMIAFASAYNLLLHATLLSIVWLVHIIRMIVTDIASFYEFEYEIAIQLASITILTAIIFNGTIGMLFTIITAVYTFAIALISIVPKNAIEIALLQERSLI